jgi:hypothetical protein
VLAAKLRVLVAEGGSLILGQGSLSVGEIDPATVAGVSEIAPTFFRALDSLSKGLRKFDYVVYEHADDLVLTAGAEVLADRHDALFNREPQRFISHMHAPAKDASAGPAIAKKGNVIRLGQPLFTQYQKVGTVAYRRVVQNCLMLLLKSRQVETLAPTSTELTVTEHEGHRLLHLVNYSPMRRGDHMEVWEDPTPLRDVVVSVPSDWVSQSAVGLPELAPLSVQYASGRATLVVPLVQCHVAIRLS